MMSWREGKKKKEKEKEMKQVNVTTDTCSVLLGAFPKSPKPRQQWKQNTQTDTLPECTANNSQITAKGGF